MRSCFVAVASVVLHCRAYLVLAIFLRSPVIAELKGSDKINQEEISVQVKSSYPSTSTSTSTTSTSIYLPPLFVSQKKAVLIGG